MCVCVVGSTDVCWCGWLYSCVFVWVVVLMCVCVVGSTDVCLCGW